MKNLLFFSVLITFSLYTVSCSTSSQVQSSGKELDQGYGTIDPNQNTTAIGQIDINENEAASVSWMELLQRTSGVMVTGSGNNLSIQIRGKKSMTSSHEPLFVLDGKPLGNGFQFISFVDPSMVRRISVLKDAASASAYGSRGADGVILVTLK